jgi:hypothetical protein
MFFLDVLRYRTGRFAHVGSRATTRACSPINLDIICRDQPSPICLRSQVEKCSPTRLYAISREQTSGLGIKHIRDDPWWAMIAIVSTQAERRHQFGHPVYVAQGRNARKAFNGFPPIPCDGETFGPAEGNNETSWRRSSRASDPAVQAALP